MRPRINNKVNIDSVIDSINRQIEVKKELVYITSRLNNCSFREAKIHIAKSSKGYKWATRWGQIKNHIKQLE